MTFHLKAKSVFLEITGLLNLFLSETTGHRRVGNVLQRREQESVLCREGMNHTLVQTV